MWKAFLKSSIGYGLPTSAWMRLSGQSLFMPFYHTISNQELPHIKHLYQVRSASLFEQDLDTLLRYFQPIDLFQLINASKGGKTLPKNAFFLSFDDGLYECATVIAPILERKGIPATFFINSAYLQSPQTLMFRYKVSLLIEHIDKNHSQNYTSILKKHLASSSVDALRKVQYGQDAILDAIANDVGFSFGEYVQKQPVYMNKQQVKVLIKKGFTIGSHSIDHPHYFKIDKEEQIRQTVVAQDYIDTVFGLDYRVFAFPFTDFGVSKEVIVRLLEEFRFDLIFGGAGLKQDSHPRHLQRFPVETQKSSSMQQLMRGEYAYYVLKSMVGKHKIHRQ